MKTTAFISAAVLASFFSAPLLAGQHDEGPQRDPAHRHASADKRSLQDMQIVPTQMSAQEPGHGWHRGCARRAHRRRAGRRHDAIAGGYPGRVCTRQSGRCVASG